MTQTVHHDDFATVLKSDDTYMSRISCSDFMLMKVYNRRYISVEALKQYCINHDQWSANGLAAVLSHLVRRKKIGRFTLNGELFAYAPNFKSKIPHGAIDHGFGAIRGTVWLPINKATYPKSQARTLPGDKQIKTIMPDVWREKEAYAVQLHDDVAFKVTAEQARSLYEQLKRFFDASNNNI